MAPAWPTSAVGCCSSTPTPRGHLARACALPLGSIQRVLSSVLDDRADLADVVVPLRERLDLAPSTIRLATVEAHLWARLRREDRLRAAIDGVRGRYDLVVVDCPPSLGLLTLNALAAADQLLIPMSCDPFALLGVTLLLQTVQELRRALRQEIPVFGLLPTRYARTTNARRVLEQARTELGSQLRVLDPIPETVRFREASGLGKTIFEHSPESPGALAYRRLAEEVDAIL